MTPFYREDGGNRFLHNTTVSTNQTLQLQHPNAINYKRRTLRHRLSGAGRRQARGTFKQARRLSVRFLPLTTPWIRISRFTKQRNQNITEFRNMTPCSLVDLIMQRNQRDGQDTWHEWKRRELYTFDWKTRNGSLEEHWCSWVDNITKTDNVRIK